MSGHSKWSTIKRAKAVVDAKRGAVFTKIGNMITIAAKKSGDPDTNFSLRVAMDKAKAVNMPKDNITKAIKRGTGELSGEEIEELIYEGIGPAQTQIIVKCLTDNKNRTAANIRHLFGKYNGSLGSVMWNFSQQGVIIIKNKELNKINSDLELELIDQDVLDIVKEQEGLTVYTNMADLNKIKQFLESKNIIIKSADIEYVAKEKKEILNTSEQDRIDKLIDALEDNEDVTVCYTNIE
ncbi:MAG: YebC/PmpR family DNA-binding transcriptional regulator [bacterium]